jgi:hypothetical protein
MVINDFKILGSESQSIFKSKHWITGQFSCLNWSGYSD